MVMINMHEAKTQFSAYVARAAAGEEVIVARAGTPVLRLVPIQKRPPRQFGVMKLAIPDDFDAPLPEEELAAWE